MRIVTLLRHQAVLQIIDLIKSYIFLLIFLLKQHTSMVHYALHRNTHWIPLVISTSRFFPHAWLITEFVTRVAWRVPLMEQELLTLLDHMSSPLVFSRARVAQSLVFCVALCRSLSVRFSFFFWPLYCLSFFNLRILITPLVSSNFSWKIWIQLSERAHTSLFM